METCPEISVLANDFIRTVLNGDPRSLDELTYASRRAFLAAHPYPAAVPTICLASSSESPLAVTAEPGEYIRIRYEERSDGLVCARDARIPGTYRIEVDGLDHASSVLVGIPGVASSYTPAKLTQALVALALEVVEGADQ
jgi:hypothetical protein